MQNQPTVRRAASRGFSLVEIMIVVGILGFIIAMAAPAYGRIRSRSQDTAVLNNVRQLASASSQYFMVNGVATAALDDLVGPDKFIKALTPTAGETYPSTYRQGEPITVTGIGGTRTLTYEP